MREVKFRAKARFNGTNGSAKWIYSSLMRLDSSTLRLNLGGQECDIETLGQFIGIYDSTTWAELKEDERSEWTRNGNMPSEWKGKEVYEGDVDEARGVCVFDGEECGFKWKDIEHGYIHEMNYIRGNLKITGNIHEQ